MLATENNDMKTIESKEFERRIDMLALTLSLKENDKYFDSSGGYPLLFSTYVEMIKNDKDQFFIEKEKKENILRSLKRTIDFWSFENKVTLQLCLEKMTMDDPTDFMIFPCAFLTENNRYNSEESLSHMVGVIIYKKKNHFVVMKVDKMECFDDNQLSYLEIPEDNITNLSCLLFSHKLYLMNDEFDEVIDNEEYLILKDLVQLSKNDEFIPILSDIMKKQKTGNCVVSEMEASLKVALFNCQKDLFSLNIDEKICLYWNLDYPKDTLEMRKRFLTAMKGDNQDWNQHFDYIFSCYVHKDKTYDTKTRKKLYEQDLYIPEMFLNKGKILSQEPTISLEIIKKKSYLLEEKYFMQTSDQYLKERSNYMLKFELKWLEGDLKILNERLPLIAIEKAKNILQQEREYLKERINAYHTEIKRRQEINLEGIEGWELQPFKRVEELAKKITKRCKKRKKKVYIPFNIKVKKVNQRMSNKRQ